MRNVRPADRLRTSREICRHVTRGEQRRHRPLAAVEHSSERFGFRVGRDVLPDLHDSPLRAVRVVVRQPRHQRLGVRLEQVLRKIRSAQRRRVVDVGDRDARRDDRTRTADRRQILAQVDVALEHRRIGRLTGARAAEIHEALALERGRAVVAHRAEIKAGRVDIRGGGRSSELAPALAAERGFE